MPCHHNLQSALTDQPNSGETSAARGHGPVRRIFLAILTVGSVTLVVKLAATFKELFVASRFGVGDELDAFLIAYMLPAFSVAVLGGAFHSSFVPAWVQSRERDGAAAANRLTENANALAAALLLAFTLLLALLFPVLTQVVASGFSPAKLELTRRLFYGLLPLIAVSGIASLWSSALNAGERFVAAGLIPLATPLAIVVLLLARPGTDPWTLVAATLAGALAELVLLALALRRHGLAVIPRWHGLDEPTRGAVRQYLPMVAGSILMGSTAVVDQSMAAMLGTGAVSALSYGNKIVGFIIGIAAVAIGTAVLPSFSTMVARSEWSELRRTLRFYSLLVVATTVPLTLGLAWLSEPIVRLLFERGAFTAADTALVAGVQRFFVLQLPFYLLGTIGVRLMSALGKNQVISTIAVLNVILNVVLNLVLSRYLGVAGIALSTSVVYTISSALVFLWLTPLLRKRRDGVR